MARGSDQAKTAATSAQNLSNGYGANSSALYGQLAPELMSEAANPQGMTPVAKAQMNTAGQQSAGGGMASAVGQGALAASRTRNAGTADAAIQGAARSAGQNASNAALKTEMADTGMKEKQKQAGLSGMENLTGMQTGASVNALGQVAGNVNADTNAQNASWDWAKYILDPAMQAAGGAASGGAFK